MLTDIIAFEWRYHTRQVSFAAAVALFFLFGFALAGTGFGPDNVYVNSPYSIAQSTGLLSLFAVFVLAAFCADAVVRDRETRMEEIVFTTSVGKLPFLLGRFTGSFLAAFTAFSASTLGMFVARFMPWQDADRVGPIHVTHYLWPLLVIALPNLLFAAAVLFALATITRNVLASYAGSVLLYVLYFVAAAMTNSPLMASSVPGGGGDPSLAALLDPFALSTFFEQTQHWTPAVRNTRLLALSGNFLLNRALWTGASLVLIAFVYRLFAFRVVSRSRKPAWIDRDIMGVTTAQALPPVSTQTSQWASYVATTKLEIRNFLLTPPFLAMTLLWATLALFELISDMTGGEYGSASYPASGMLFATIQQPLTLVATILLIYTAAELVWRERSLRISGILNATPTSNVVFVASKCTALTALVATLTGIAMIAIALLQLAKGGSPEPLLLLSFAYYAGMPLVLFACAAVVIQTLSRHKYFGMLLVLLLAIVSLRGEIVGLRHPLWRFASAPDVVYSDMNGFGRTGTFHWSMLYWGALTGVLLLLAIARWRHGADRFHRLIATALTLVFVASGVHIFYNTSYETPSQLLQWKADYEKTYKQLAALPQPGISTITAQIDLYPADGRYRVRGEYLLTNETSKPIGKVVVIVRRDANATHIAAPSAHRIEHDKRFNQYTVQLAQPLQPSAQTKLQFDITYADDTDETILDNGSYIPNQRAFPTIGYRASYEIAEPRERRRHGLPEQHIETTNLDWVSSDLTISTVADQTAIAPGRLVRTWTANGRRSFRYRSDAPMPNQCVIASGRYAVAKETHAGIPIEIDYHPTHTYNVARMMHAASDALTYYSANFGAYPYPALRLVEVPAQLRNFSGYAQPGVVFFGENRGFLIDARDPDRLDLVYRRVAHEVAHQWWGYSLTAADGPGASMLVESLTKYSELMVLEHAYGREQVRQSLTYELDLYLSGRTDERGTEPPLTRVDDQSYLYYRKGALVFYALKDLLGERTLNAALHNLLQEQRGPHHRPTSADFVRHLRAVAPPTQYALIDDWLNDVVLYDLKLESVSSRRLADGRYEVRMRVSAAKDSHDKPVPMRENVDIGIFSADDKTLYLAKHALHDGIQDITILVNGAPTFVAVDPYLTRMDRNRFDNGKHIQ